MPRPSEDFINLLITNLTNYIKDKNNNNVNIKAGWITSETTYPIATVTKIGEWCNVISLDGDVKAGWGDWSLDLWAKDLGDLFAMEQSAMSRLKDLRKSFKDKGIFYNVDMAHKRIPEPEIAPLLQRTNIIIRAYWFE